MPFSETLYDVRDHVATVTLNRPGQLNAWTSTMEQEVTLAVRAASADGRVRVIVLTGAGRGFCSGADMGLLEGLLESRHEFSSARSVAADEPGEGARMDFEKKFTWMLAVPKPIIAAINGPAVGLGFVIPLYCDLRIASEAAIFATIFSRRGLVAEYGVAWMLPRLVGLANTVDLLFTSRKVDAAEALRLGLVQRVLPEAGFAEAVESFAAELASSVSPRSLAVIKRQTYEAQFQTLAESMDMAVEEMARSFESQDFREGVAHFIEKREPAFTGR